MDQDKRETVNQDRAARATSEARITYVGHATVLLEMNGVRILTDPIVRNRITFLRRRRIGHFRNEFFDRVDAVLISHLHHDHMDPPSLRRVGPAVRILAPNGAGDLLRNKGMQDVVEMREGEALRIGPLTVRATFADHNARRHPFGPIADCLGYVIEGDYSVYFPGDTDIFPEMETLAEDLDVALMPVWGWGPSLGSGHLDPQSAAEALRLLRPKLAIPIHWGAFVPAGLGMLNMSFMTLPPHRFHEHAAALAPDVDVRVLLPGEAVSLPQLLD